MRLALFFFSLLFSQSIFGQKEKTTKYKLDPDRIVILKEKDSIKKSNKVILSNAELALTDKLFRTAVDEYNTKLDSLKDAQDFLIIEDYRRQYIPWMQNGEKFIYVNCFCGNGMMFGNWKKEQIVVFDGGKCFFGLLINLTKKEYSHLYVNGKG